MASGAGMCRGHIFYVKFIMKSLRNNGILYYTCWIHGRNGQIILSKSWETPSIVLSASKHRRYGREVVQEEPSGAGLAQVKSDAYEDLGAKAFLSVLVAVSG